MHTDYAITGKLYNKLDAYVQYSSSIREVWAYFGSSVQFRTCASFLRYLEDKHPNARFSVSRA
jgi:hypothetical protein